MPFARGVGFRQVFAYFAVYCADPWTNHETKSAQEANFRQCADLRAFRSHIEAGCREAGWQNPCCV